MQSRQRKLNQTILRWLEKILQERFGIFFRVCQLHSGNTSISLPSIAGAIILPSPTEVFHECHSDFSCTEWCAENEGFTSPLSSPIPMPGMEAPPTPLVERKGQNHLIYYDILGLTYWMLTRLEEVNRTDLDQYNRFPATSSHAYNKGYLKRPIIDEWLSILGQVIHRQWPAILLKTHQFDIKVSHDVDRPARYAYQSWQGLLRSIAGDLIIRRNLKNAILAPWIFISTKSKLHKADPFNTFNWIMSQSEEHGITSAFYFICGRTDPEKDAKYNPRDPLIRNLLRNIHQRGHEIGLHPSFNTYRSPKKIIKEANTLKSICEEEAIKQTKWGGRMHYLRWSTPHTLKAWAQAGMTYDSTLGYADHPGFRCGTCFDYPGFDPLKNKPLSIRVRPLIAMEQSIISKKHMNLGHGKNALDVFFQLRQACYAVNGTFTLLWHNSELDTKIKRDLYLRCIRKQPDNNW